jgi:hypothetical protein
MFTDHILRNFHRVALQQNYLPEEQKEQINFSYDSYVGQEHDHPPLGSIQLSLGGTSAT